MHINADKNILNALNSFQLGIISFKTKVRSSPYTLTQSIDSETLNIREKFELNEIKDIPDISAARAAYKLCGNDPNRYRPSADSLYRRIVKGSSLYQVNNVVDCLNLISITTGISIGGYDFEKIDGDAEIGIGMVCDQYTGIGRGELNINNLPVLRDNTGTFGNPTSDSVRTMITENADSILFVFYDFSADPKLNETLNDSVNVLKKYCMVENESISILSFNTVK